MPDQMWFRWAVPPSSPGASRAERARQAAAEAGARHEIRWIWNELCSGLDLTRRIVPTGTISREPPRVGRVFLGPPTHFTVELRPGQLREDVERLSTRIAAAYDVPEVEVRDLARGWIVIELIEHGHVAPGAPAGAVEPVRPSPPPPPTVPHLPPRPARGPFGRPRSWGLRRPRRQGT